MNDRHPHSLLQIRELGHGIHDLPGFERATSAYPPSGSIPTRRDCRSTAPLKRCSSSSRGASRSSGATRARVSTELGVGDTASTNPPAVEVLLAGAEGATFLALVSRG